MGNVDDLPEAERAKLEELRKLSPSTAYKLYEVINGAEESRKEDHETMERLAGNLREDMQKTLSETMRSVVILIDGLRTDMRCQDVRIGKLENDVQRIKEHVGIAI